MTEDLIDFLGSLSIQQAFAIGRIAEQDAIILRQYQAPDILTAKLNQIIHMTGNIALSAVKFSVYFKPSFSRCVVV